MKKRSTTVIKAFLAMVMLFTMSIQNTVLTSAVEKDFGESVTTSANIAVYSKDNSSWEYFVENNVIVDENTILKTNDEVLFNIKWQVNNEIEIQTGDYFEILISSSYIDYNFYVDNEGEIDPNNPGTTKYKPLLQNGLVLGYWTLENRVTSSGEKESYIKFIAHENFTALASRVGEFNITGIVKSLGTDTVKEPISIGKVTIENITFEDPTYVDPDTTTPPEKPTGFPVTGVAGERPMLSKYAGTMNSYTPTGKGKREWIASFGLELLRDVMPHNANHENIEKLENVVLYDTLEGEQYFIPDEVWFSSSLYRPANQNGDMSYSHGSGDNIRGVGITKNNQEQDEDYETWKAEIENSEVPMQGVSYDRKTFIANLGTIGDNGLTYGNNNAEIEANLRAKTKNGAPLYSDDEIKALMKSIGYDTDEHTLQTGEKISIDSYGNGQVIAYSLYMRVEAEPNPEKYSNTIEATVGPNTISYEVPAENGIFVSEFTGEIDGIYKGKVRVLKYDQETQQPIVGTEFTLYVFDGTSYVPYIQDGNEVKGVTDENGELLITHIDEGTYRLVETNPTPGYDPLSLKLYTQPVGIDDEVITKDYTNEVEEFEVAFIGSKPKDYVFVATNQEVPLGVSLQKTDATTNVAIPKTTFLLEKYGKDSWQAVGTYTTDNQGMIVLDETVISEGQYRFSETIGAVGYVKESAIYTGKGVTVTDNYAHFTIDRETTNHISLNVTNEPFIEMPSTTVLGVTIQVNDLHTNESLPTTEFLLEIYEDGIWKIVDTYIAGGDGTITINSNLTEGTYRLSETLAATGYLKNSAVYTSANITVVEQYAHFVLQQGVVEQVDILVTNEKIAIVEPGVSDTQTPPQENNVDEIIPPSTAASMNAIYYVGLCFATFIFICRYTYRLKENRK